MTFSGGAIVQNVPLVLVVAGDAQVLSGLFVAGYVALSAT